MKLKVIEEKDNPVLQRKELKIEVDYEGGPTPKLEEVASAVAKERGAEPSLVEVSKLFSATGRTKGLAFVKIWASKEAREKAKPHKRVLKEAGKPGEKKEAPAPEEKAEKPKES